jgi:hypothetical protein
VRQLGPFAFGHGAHFVGKVDPLGLQIFLPRGFSLERTGARAFYCRDPRTEMPSTKGVL